MLGLCQLILRFFCRCFHCLNKFELTFAAASLSEIILFAILIITSSTLLDSMTDEVSTISVEAY